MQFGRLFVLRLGAPVVPVITGASQLGMSSQDDHGTISSALTLSGPGSDPGSGSHCCVIDCILMRVMSSASEDFSEEVDLVDLVEDLLRRRFPSWSSCVVLYAIDE
jgi:hypothetical protein